MAKYAKIASIVKQETSEINDDKHMYSRLSESEYSDLMRGFDYDKHKDEHEYRRNLSETLKWVSICWLAFTGLVIVCIGLGWFVLSDNGVISFIIGSLAEVFGLWTISLKYFYRNSQP